ncbi:MAG: Type secretion system protein ImpE [Pseudomonas sp.]|jgi:type VI secretion system protein ImpE|uniref:type VI secretion system accessory protein TagJ n=1 Tax=Pseudomonas sp. TaxID=306 RepID=UPI002623295B|nr:type VI secretion system accessory protein TagJ [Pseudomonas sp.]MDB6050851.1 Type secretion system protein ImpE [Pseudomonas sp.]
MHPLELINEGKLAAALAGLQDLVRKDAANAKYRIFLFQLLAVMGQWNRALTQLNVAGELEASALPMVQTYREAIQCEALRNEIFAGARLPLIFGEPPAWVGQLLEALKFAAAGDAQRSSTARELAFDAAPATGGSINGERFEWLADADPRLGPVLETVVNGRYFWIPMQRIRRIEIDAPVDLRDTVWTPASFTWTNGAQTVGLIPTRYDASVANGDEALLMARRTEWDEVTGHGLGQRMLATDAGDYPLMDVRTIEFDVLPELEDVADGPRNG